MDYSKIAKEIDILMRAQAWYDFGISTYNDGLPLVLRGSLDTTFGYNLELIFSDVKYIELPTSWGTPNEVDSVFRYVSPADLDLAQTERLLGVGGKNVFGILAEFQSTRQWLYVVADSVSYRHNSTSHWPWGS